MRVLCVCTRPWGAGHAWGGVESEGGDDGHGRGVWRAAPTSELARAPNGGRARSFLGARQHVLHHLLCSWDPGTYRNPIACLIYPMHFRHLDVVPLRHGRRDLRPPKQAQGDLSFALLATDQLGRRKFFMSASGDEVLHNPLQAQTRRSGIGHWSSFCFLLGRERQGQRESFRFGGIGTISFTGGSGSTAGIAKRRTVSKNFIRWPNGVNPRLVTSVRPSFTRALPQMSSTNHVITCSS